MSKALVSTPLDATSSEPDNSLRTSSGKQDKHTSLRRRRSISVVGTDLVDCSELLVILNLGVGRATTPWGLQGHAKLW
jgi:hypothetical protein